MTLLSYIIVTSSILLILLAILHEWAGYQAYTRGRTLDIFDKWVPQTSKQRTLLGVFFMISFPWIFVEIVNIVMIMGTNSFGIWLGWLNLLIKIPQLILLFVYVSWNRLAQLLYGLNTLIWLYWLVISTF